MLEAAGGRAVTVPLLADHPARLGVAAANLPAVARGRAVPESLVWAAGSAERRLRGLDPDLVVCVTSRAYHPSLSRGPWVTVLDHVDRLGLSYTGRSRIARSAPRRATYRALSATARRFERAAGAEGVHQVAAGWADAAALGAVWLPIAVDAPDPRPEPDDDSGVDVCFVGTLSYPPNVEAVRSLAAAWPSVRAARPAATALIAGANPIDEVRDCASSNGWQLVANFDDAAEIYRRARVAVSPLRTATGIQIKVLDAARYGVAQVASPAALDGLAPGFPAAVAASPEAMAAELVALLGDPDRRRRLAGAAAEEIGRTYSPGAWVDTIRLLLSAVPGSIGARAALPTLAGLEP
jgi:glycosyltransferase involved in cell wall biosynthesis